jgi:large subunit ribosomal protein L3
MNLDGLMGIKKYQSQAFLEDGKRVPTSAILASGNVITQVKTEEKEGYTSIQLGFGVDKKANKAKLGNGKKAGLEKAPRFFRELRLADTGELKAGTEVPVAEVLTAGDIIDVIGQSKGKGFAGVVKRHHFRGGPRTHGQSDRERAPGSIGQTTTPGRVYKGKRMAGRMGDERVTVKNLQVLEVREDGTILISGLIPGSVNSLVMIKKVGENKKFVPLYKEVKEEEVAEEVKVPEAEAPEAPVETAPEEVVQPAEEVVEAPVDTVPEEAKTEDVIEETIEASGEVAPEVETVEETKEEVKEEGEENAGN